MPLQKQVAHLQKDRILKKVIQKAGAIDRGRENDLYLALMRAIVGQQLSVKAAATIWSRFLALFPGNYPSPDAVLATDAGALRSAGLSFQKAGYLRNIAAFSLEQTLDYGKLQKLSDEDLISYLVQIKGVGRWTVEMILMFSLGRPDVFPRDDLGIQNGMQILYKLRYSSRKELHSAMEKVSEKWKPYRSLACMYIWKAKDEAVKANKKTRPPVKPRRVQIKGS